MPIYHILFALLVVIAWGLNFIFVKLGLEEIPPLLLCALRFLLASVPAVFFIKPPNTPFRIILLYGLVMFALQFSLLFLGMQMGMPPGMASLLMQVQVFFSLFFAILFLGEAIGFWQIVGAITSFFGIGLVALHLDHNMSVSGFLLILAASATWGVGNLISKKIKTTNMMAVVVWASFIACLPMFLISLIFEGPDAYRFTVEHLSWQGISALLYIVFVSTWLGYGLWNWLLSRYPVSVIVPFNLLVPVVGIIGSILILQESFQSWKLFAGLLIIAGLCINLLGNRLSKLKQSSIPEVA